MKGTRKPWTTKLRPEMQPETADDPKGRGVMLFPTPLLIAGEISAIPEGQIITVSELRARLARGHQANVVCPLMTGIFYNIIAGAAEEQLAAGQPPLAPYWRVIPDNGTLSPKTPCGPETQANHLRREGHAVEVVREKLQVAGFQTPRRSTAATPAPL